MSFEPQLLTAFNRNRPRLLRLAKRMLDHGDEAQDALQAVWLKVGQLELDDIRNVDAWFTTVTTRICLDRLRQRSRQEPSFAPVSAGLGGRTAASEDRDPEQEALLADSVGVALMVVLDRLSPLERVAFVLHDILSIPFEEVATLIDRSPDASRQLASRARRRVRGAPEELSGGLGEHRRLAQAFLLAARTGDIAGLLEVLHPDVALVPDARAAAMGPGGPVAGAHGVAGFFAGRASGAHLALIDGEAGLVVAPDARLLIALLPTYKDGRIMRIRAVAEPETLARLRISLLA